jgi:3-phosphoshikimate 1-carboxyvinyltransferase
VTKSLPAFKAHPVPQVAGTISVPGDKSISHRALMLGAIASGQSVIHGFLRSDDCLATRAALEAMGVAIRDLEGGSLAIEGVGLRGLKAPRHTLDLGNSGTAIRLMIGLLAGQSFSAELTGDASLQQRPMERVAVPLRAMGAAIETTSGRPPVRIGGGRALHGIEYELTIASAQVKSALLLAALYANGATVLRSPGPSRDHTEKMLASMGVAIRQDEANRTVSLTGPAEPRGIELTVPGDFSSAAFFIVAGVLAAEEGLLIRGVGVNPTRTGLLTILRAMGARIELLNPRLVGAEPVADVRVRRSPLRGIEVPPELVPLAIDEFPILFIAAAGAVGTTVVREASELRTKESDRIAVMAQGLSALGVTVRESPGGLSIEGARARGLDGATIDSRGDHRVAMSFAVASLLATGPIEILNTAEVATSFPSFVDVATAAGLKVVSGGRL